VEAAAANHCILHTVLAHTYNSLKRTVCECIQRGVCESLQRWPLKKICLPIPAYHPPPRTTLPAYHPPRVPPSPRTTPHAHPPPRLPPCGTYHRHFTARFSFALLNSLPCLSVQCTREEKKVKHQLFHHVVTSSHAPKREKQERTQHTSQPHHRTRQWGAPSRPCRLPS